MKKVKMASVYAYLLVIEAMGSPVPCRRRESGIFLICRGVQFRGCNDVTPQGNQIGFPELSRQDCRLIARHWADKSGHCKHWHCRKKLFRPQASICLRQRRVG